MMAYFDLREYLAKLSQAGELRDLTAEISPKLEAGAILQRIAERGGPAVHVKHVHGARFGASLVGGTMSRGSRHLWGKVAVALECDPALHHRELLDEVCKRIESPVRPMEVDGGACKENVITDDAVDLTTVLAPTLAEEDSGPCLSSWAFAVVREPGSGRVIWDLLPHIVNDRNTLLSELDEDSPAMQLFRDRYEPQNEPMPFAIVLGAVPVAPLAAAFRRGRESAVDLAGGLQRAPLQLTRCETSDLMVPAQAEWILEGVVRPGERISSPSLTSTFGYRARHSTDKAVWEVRAMTHRNQPILPYASWGVPVNEIHLARSLDCDTQVRQEFMRRGFPIRDVYSPPWLAGAAVAVSTQVPYSAFSQAAAGVVRTTEAGRKVPYVLVCDADIDITKPVTLFHALVTKCHPARDAWATQNTLASSHAPYLDKKERDFGTGAARLFDCTWPLDWDRSIAVPPRVSFDQCYPPNLQKQVLEEWNEVLGFPDESQRPLADV